MGAKRAVRGGGEGEGEGKLGGSGCRCGQGSGGKEGGALRWKQAGGGVVAAGLQSNGDHSCALLNSAKQGSVQE